MDAVKSTSLAEKYEVILFGGEKRKKTGYIIA